MEKNDTESAAIVSPSRIVQNFLVVWLDGNINEDNNEYRNTITKIRKILSHYHYQRDKYEPLFNSMK
jgi:hypothetical protein